MKIFYFGDRTVELEKFAFAIAEDIPNFTSTSTLWQEIGSSEEDQIVVVGSDVSISDAFAISEKCRVEHPHTRVILSRPRLDVDVLARALRSGIAEVVSADDPTSFAESVRRINELFRAGIGKVRLENGSNRRARIIVVFSAKGGCGKTTVSINLATTLSMESKVCLIDLDLQFGDIAVSMQKDPEKTISSSIAMGTDIDKLGARSMLTNYNKNLDLLLAPNNPTDVEFINGSIIGAILESLKSDYDYIVIDTPPAFTDFVLKAMEMMDVCFLITTLDMPALKNMRVVIDTMKALKLDLSNLNVVINRSDSKTGISLREAEELIDRPISFKVPNETNVSIATNRGVPTCTAIPKSDFSKEFRSMRTYLNELFAIKSSSENPKRSLMRRIFS